MSRLSRSPVDHKQKKFSTYKHVVGTFFPVVGVVLFGWDITYIFMQYWVRFIVESSFEILKIFVCTDTRKMSVWRKILGLTGYAFDLSFKTAAYGVFSGIATVMIYAVTYPDENRLGELIQGAYYPIAFYAAVVILFEIFDFLVNFIAKKQYKKISYYQLYKSYATNAVGLHLSILGFIFVGTFSVVLIREVLRAMNNQFGFNFLENQGLRVPIQVVAGIVIGLAQLGSEKLVKMIQLQK